jgi:hypothetical protein
MLVDDWTKRDRGELRRSCMGRLQMCMHERTSNFLGQIINESYRPDSNLARLSRYVWVLLSCWLLAFESRDMLVST